jgi:hypothetical protein
MADVTQILAAVEAGDPHAAAESLPLVCDGLGSLAAARLPENQHEAGPVLMIRVEATRNFVVDNMRLARSSHLARFGQDGVSDRSW